MCLVAGLQCTLTLHISPSLMYGGGIVTSTHSDCIYMMAKHRSNSGQGALESQRPPNMQSILSIYAMLNTNLHSKVTATQMHVLDPSFSKRNTLGARQKKRISLTSHTPFHIHKRALWILAGRDT